MSFFNFYHNANAKDKLIIGLSIVSLFLLFYCMTYLFPISDDFRDILNFVIQIIITVILSFIFISYTFYKNQEEQFINALMDLTAEMITNTERLSDNFLNSQLEKIPIKIQNNDWPGVDKWPSFTNWDNSQNFYLKYLPNTYYFNFVTTGLFCSTFADKITDSMKQLIAKTYFKFSNISIEIQKYENWIMVSNGGILPDNYRFTYLHKIIEPNLKMYYTDDFFGETTAVIGEIVNNYPEIKKVDDFIELKRKLGID